MTSHRLNQSCHCITLDADQLARQLDARLLEQAVLPQILEGRENLFAPYGVFVNGAQVKAMTDLIAAVEALVALPDYQGRPADYQGYQAEMASGPEQHTRGVFMGYDFHLSDNGAQLIEINTNAGGAFLNALLLRSQRACCEPVSEWLRQHWYGEDAQQAFVDMFREEWRLARGDQPLRSILIVDDDPQKQFLYPEFQLFRQLFRSQGWWCEIADPAQLQWREGRLWLEDQAIDLVYNRLTDFDLSEPRHAALRDAYAADALVLTPSPRHHSLYANKRNLVLLSDDAALQQMGLHLRHREALQRSVPKTELLSPDQAERLWSQRKSLFFKPARGYGGKATYRGDKITKSVWADIVASGDYIAQAYAPPAERHVTPGQAEKPLKFDVRCYTYGGRIQLMAARLYQGQTTNFRTPLGGFAAVFAVKP